MTTRTTLYIFVLCLSHRSRAIQQCADESVVGMVSPAAMVGGGDIRRTYGRGYVMTNHAYVARCCGVVKRWTFSVDRSALPNPIQLHVWRPLSDGATFTLVGETRFYAESRRWYTNNEDDYADDDDDDEDEDDGDDDDYEGRRSRVMSVIITEGQRISIREGDVIGWRSPGGDVVSYTTRYYNLDNIIVSRMGEVVVGANYVFPKPLMSHRTYGINAVLTTGAAPIITNLPASVELQDDVKEGTIVFNVTGYDADPGDMAIFVIPGDEDDQDALPFVVEAVSGTVTTIGKPSRPSYDISVVMTDACGLYDVGTLTVLVKSAFHNSPPTMTLPQALAIAVTGVTVNYTYTVVIEDQDDDNVTCDIRDVQPAVPFFSMKGTDLLVQILKDATFDPEFTYRVSVTCSDGTVDVTKVLNVTFFRHTPPAFLNSSTTLHVSTRAFKTGDIIDVIQATSTDQLPLAFWAEECNCPFYLHPDGSVAVSRSLMSEPVTSYSLNVHVSDGVSSAGPALVRLILTEINQLPEFANVAPSVVVEENSSGAVFAVHVTDPDGDDVVVSLTWSPVEGGAYFFFNQSSKTVEVRPSTVLDFEHLADLRLTQLVLQMSASDGFKTSSVNVTLIISDVNEPPECSQTHFYISVNEGNKGTIASDGTFLTSSCSDPESKPLLYSIFQSSISDHSFVINKRDATLTYSENVDVNSTTLTSFSVRVSDVGEQSIEVEVEVEVHSVHKSPEILNLPRRLAVSEDASPGKLFTVRTVGEDPADVVEVYFTVLQGDPELFELQGKHLHLRHSRSFNYEMTSSHLIEFVADNGHVTSDPVTLTLDVMDVNEPPTFSQSSFNLTVREEEEGTVVLANLRSMTTDPDTDDAFTFSLITFSEYFKIHPRSAVISFAVDYDVDRDVMPRSVTLIVKAVDRKLLSATTRVNVNIVNRNEPPRIVNLPREVTVSEGAATGRVIYRVVTEDPENDDVILRMSVTEGSGKYFGFNNTDGTLYVKQSRGFDFETTPLFILRFIADDGSLTSSPVTLTVHVSDVNEAPYFTRDTFYVSVPEGPAGKVIGDGGILSSVHDPEDDLLTFDLIPGSEASGLSVDRKTAELVFASDFVLTRQNSPLVVSLTIRTKDPGDLSASAKVKVTIHHVNTRPRLLYLPANITVPEATKEGELLYTFLAEDFDNDVLLFRLNTLYGGGRHLFHLNSSTGDLLLAHGSSLSRTHAPFFTLQVSVTDGQLSSHPALLTLSVVRDSAVTSQPYFISVREDELAFPIELPPSLTAEGPQTTGPLSYHISGGNAQVHFRIDSTTGSLFFTGNDDFDDPSVNSTLTLDITVSDLSGRNRKVKVEVKVVDVNDNAPEVTSDLVTLLVSKTSPVGTVIGHIEARDRDRGENGRLNYEIVASTVPQSTFRIKPSGAVVVNKPLTAVSSPHATLRVVITDNGSPPLSTSVAVFVIFHSRQN